MKLHLFKLQIICSHVIYLNLLISDSIVFWKTCLSLLAFILFPKYHIFLFLIPKLFDSEALCVLVSQLSDVHVGVPGCKFLVGCLIDSEKPYCICSSACLHLSRLEILVHVVRIRSDNLFLNKNESFSSYRLSSAYDSMSVTRLQLVISF